MRLIASLVLMGLACCNTGCGIVKYSTINLWVPPGRILNQWRNRLNECEAAEVAWKQMRYTCPDGEYSKAFAKGFKKGFIEYLDANGTPQPPGAPPYCYRFLCFESPDGT